MFDSEKHRCTQIYTDRPKQPKNKGCKVQDISKEETEQQLSDSELLVLINNTVACFTMVSQTFVKVKWQELYITCTQINQSILCLHITRAQQVMKAIS